MRTMDWKAAEKEVDRIVEDNWREHYSVPTAPIYHYTTVAAASAILQTQEFWATNVRYLNDPVELDYTSELLQEVIVGLRARYPSPIDSMFLDAVSKAVEMYDDALGYYVVCFSGNPDAKTIWSSYNAAEGLAIALDPGPLLTRWQPVGPLFQEVIYDRERQTRIILDLLEKILALFAGFDHANPEAEFFNVEILASDVRLLLSDYAVRFKSEHFSDEQEWRAVYVSLPYDINDSGYRPIQPVLHNGTDFRNVKFRSGRDTLIPYIPVNLLPRDEKGRLPVVGLTYGWKLDPALTPRALELMRSRFGYPTATIKQSKVRLR